MVMPGVLKRGCGIRRV